MAACAATRALLRAGEIPVPRYSRTRLLANSAPSAYSAAAACLPTAGRAEARSGPFTGDGGFAATRAQLRAGASKKF